jgi:fatty acid desaturase
MKDQVRLSSTEIGRSTPSRWLILEYTLIAVECVAIGAMLGWLFAGGTLFQVAVGALAGLMLAALIPSLAAVRVMPDSFIVAAACLILWLVVVLPLLVVPFALCSWLGSTQGPLKAQVD